MPVFTYLGLKNFRAFEEVAIDLAPITILVGPNNAGKTSIISALRVLAQTAASEDFRVPLLLKGSMGDFGTYHDLVYQNDRRRSVGITLGTDLPHTRGKEARVELNFAYRSQRREVVLRDSAMYDQAGRKLLSTAYSASSSGKQVVRFGSQTNGGAPPTSRRSVRQIHFLVSPYSALLQLSRRTGKETLLPEANRAEVLAMSIYRELLRALRSIEYLGPFRASPERTPLFSGERPTSVGMDGAKAIHLLASDYLARGRQKKRLLQPIIRWLKAAGIAKDIKVRVLSDRHFEMLVQHAVTDEYENLADVGYGISQVLPVIAAGQNMGPGVTLIVEQPEIHLHPRGQAELGDFFAGLYERDVQSILETHSEHLIVRLQRHVATGRIKSKDLLVYYVHSHLGKKQAVRLPVGEDGLFLRDWPQGFFEERLEEVTALARASSEESRPKQVFVNEENSEDDTE